MTNKGYDNKIAALQLVDDGECGESREDLFIRNLFVCNTIKEAALKAGYSKSYATGPLYLRLKNPSFQNKIRAYFTEHVQLAIPKIAKLQDKILNYLNEGENFKQEPKFKHISKQILQITGLLKDDSAKNSQPIINLTDIRIISQMLLEKPNLERKTDKARFLPDDIRNTKSSQ